jgi:hypothetical protein
VGSCGENLWVTSLSQPAAMAELWGADGGRIRKRVMVRWTTFFEYFILIASLLFTSAFFYSAHSLSPLHVGDRRLFAPVIAASRRRHNVCWVHSNGDRIFVRKRSSPSYFPCLVIELCFSEDKRAIFTDLESRLTTRRCLVTS